MDNHFFMLAMVMLLAGSFGGVVNFYLHARDDDAPYAWVRPVVLGIGAAFLVPVVLDMLSIKLVLESQEDPSKLLIFTSICLIASIASRYLTTSSSDQIKADVSFAREQSEALLLELRNLQDEVLPLIETETEKDSLGDGCDYQSLAEDIDVACAKVLKTLGSGRFIFRCVNGLCEDSQCDEATVKHSLSVLQGRGLVSRSRGRLGERWYLNARGHQVLERL